MKRQRQGQLAFRPANMGSTLDPLTRRVTPYVHGQRMTLRAWAAYDLACMGTTRRPLPQGEAGDWIAQHF
jgi:hypothetical protein